LGANPHRRLLPGLWGWLDRGRALPPSSGGAPAPDQAGLWVPTAFCAPEVKAGRGGGCLAFSPLLIVNPVSGMGRPGDWDKNNKIKSNDNRHDMHNTPVQTSHSPQPRQQLFIHPNFI